MSEASAPERPAPHPRRVPLWAAALLVVLLPLAAWLVAVATDDDGGDAAVVVDPGVAHVHGLGVDPADGALYAATHSGLFLIPDEGSARRIGGSFQDTMGFTVVGPNRFLGSGHPDAAGLRAGQPGLLGLIESDDAGETWEPVSLGGEVDFHALAFVHGAVYGWDATSSRFLVSADMKSWEERSAQIMSGFAVDPDDGDYILAVGPGGVLASVDGGRTWSGANGPQLVAISWRPKGGVWGVDASGGVHRSADRGGTWERVGEVPGEPQALLATEDALWAAAHNADGATGLYRSADDGNT
jgi:hypothetical protein